MLERDPQRTEAFTTPACEPHGWLREGVAGASFARLKRRDSGLSQRRDIRSDSSVES
jgi:hypothetical protein